MSGERRLPAATGEAFRRPAGRAALHVDDLAAVDRQDLEVLVLGSVRVTPGGRADQLVVADHRELGFDREAGPAVLGDLERQDLTGLVGAVSGGRVLPPQVTVRDAAPFGVVGEERGEGAGIAAVERVGRCAQLVDHEPSMSLARGGCVFAPGVQH